MPKANQKFTNTKPPKGNITSNKIGNGSFSHPDDLKMIPGSLQYENQMRRFENAKGN